MVEYAGFEEYVAELKDFALGLRNVAEDIRDEAVADGVKKTAFQVEGTAKRKAPVYDPPSPEGGVSRFEQGGELRRDLMAHEEDKKTEWAVGSTKEYAPPQEYGAKPHPIVATDAPFLVFWWEKEQKWVTTSAVQHPGHEAQPFLRPALDEHRDDLKENIDDELEKLIEERMR